MSTPHTPQQPSDGIIKALLEAFTYDPETGELRWNLDRPRDHFPTERGYKIWLGTAKKQTAVGTAKADNGHLRVIFGHPLLEQRKAYQVHHLAWLLHHKVWPSSCLDHINGDRADNRISNLRVVSHRQNMQNRKDRSTIGTGVQPSGGKYLAQIRLFGNYYYIGTYETPDIATVAYDCVLMSFVRDLDEGPNGLSRADLEDAIVGIPKLKQKIEQIREENGRLSIAA